jgi:hypothetical protein
MFTESQVEQSKQSPRGVWHRGPHPGYVAIVFTVLFLASLVPVTLLLSKTHFPAPYQTPQEIVAYFQAESAKVAICAFLQFGSSIPLGIFTATMVSRLRFHRVQAAGATIALFGGLGTSFFMALSALVQWTVAQPGVAKSPDLTRALYYLLFSTGGVGYSVPLGLLFAGLSVSAGLMRLLPRWLAIFGVTLGLIGELSSLSLVIPGALFLIPLTRFPGFVWLIAAGFALPNRRAGAG